MRRCDAEAEGQRQYADDGESLRPNEPPQRVAHVVDDRFEHRKASLFSERFLDLRHTAELDAGRPAGLGGRHPGAHVLGGEEVEVHLDLLLRLPLEAAAHEQVPEAGNEHDDTLSHGHGSAGIRRRRVMTPAMRSQSLAWAVSCRRPVAVMA